MNNEAEKNVSEFYNTVGWETDAGITKDARDSEDLRECAREYVAKCRLRVLREIPPQGENLLDMASGPIQYREYLEYSKNYRKRYCVDLSSKALADARNRIGDHGEYLCGSFFDIPLQANFFDCTISLHTIYHIDKDRQEEAVRKLIHVTKPGRPVIIVYSNPDTLISYPALPFRYAKQMLRAVRRRVSRNDLPPDLYFFRHPLIWWERFTDVAHLRLLPWRSLASNHQKYLIPNNKYGKRLFDTLYAAEERFPGFFVRNFQYPMIVLTKRV
jgi:SAM-dependent methyltransferase